MTVFHSLFSLLCHQLPSRSPQCLGEVFPVCFRCAGLYFGVLSTYIFLLPKKKLFYFSIDTKTGFILALFIVPLFLDGVANFFALWSTPGLVRALTGTLAGLTLPLFLIFIQNFRINSPFSNKITVSYVIVPLIISSSFDLLLTVTTF